MGNRYETINKAKAPMGHIYNRPDPRAYYRELEKLDYSIPNEAKPIFEAILRQMRRTRRERLHILDLGCSYGVNAALLKHDLSMSDLYEHWSEAAIDGAGRDAALDHERNFLEAADVNEDISFYGLDTAEEAIAFAEEAGLLDEGFSLNLEKENLDSADEETLARVDLVISTGCVGYVTERSFERLLPAITRGRKPWLANFVLRVFPFDQIERTFEKWGYVTEKLEGRSFIQRQFSSEEERTKVFAQLADQGIDPAGVESDGKLHAEFFLSRPREEAARLPLAKLFANETG
jgi:SAM-dependent methyltransferase